jgi:hypothetical protein
MQKSTIALSVESKKGLRSLGIPDQSYDELVQILLGRLQGVNN